MIKTFNEYIEMARLKTEDLKKKGSMYGMPTGWYHVGQVFDHVVKRLKAKGIKKEDVSEKEMVKMVGDAITSHGHFAHADWRSEVKDMYYDWQNNSRRK